MQINREDRNRYYGELNIAVMVESLLCNEEFLSAMDADGIELNLVLKSSCGKKKKTEVLHVDTNWVEWESI